MATEMTKTMNRYANLFFTPEGMGMSEWSLGDAFESFAAAKQNGSRGWAFALTAWSELGDAEAQQVKELEHLKRYAEQQLDSMTKGYRVDTTWINGAAERLEKATAKVEELINRLNSFVLILTDRKNLSL